MPTSKNSNMDTALLQEDATENCKDWLEETESPHLYSGLTVTENPFGISVWDHYEKIRLLDDGGTGELWLAYKRHPDDNDNKDDDGAVHKKFAIKCIDKNFLFGIFTKELRNEFENLRKIDHPHVVRIYETYETREDMFLVMEYCAGGDLNTCLPDTTEPEAARILTQILSVVAYCHKQKIVHRDIKMENILRVDRDSHVVKMIDFGYAQHFRRSRGDYTMQMDIGTTYTMSPQVLQGKYTEKCDVWSVGVVAFMLLSGGERPFDAKEDKDIRSKIKEGKYSMFGPQWDIVSDEGKSFVKSLLEYDPDARPSAEEAAQARWLKRYAESPENEASDALVDTVQDAILSSVGESKLKRLSMMIVAHNASAKKLHELRQLFDAFDLSNDGTIDRDEFKAVMGGIKLPAEKLEEVFEELDQNDTGVINYTEFVSAVLESAVKIDEDLVKGAFDKLDANSNGFLDKQGLSSVSEETKAESKEPEEEAEKLLHEVCGSHDGKMSYKEFASMFTGESLESTSQHPIGSSSSK